MATINGTSAGDWLSGTTYADVINGFDGQDTLKGGGGADRLDGGNGSDTALYSDSTEGVYVDLSAGIARYGSAEGDVLVGIENLSGSLHDDTLFGDNGANLLFGSFGDDLLNGGGGADVMNGGLGDDGYLVQDTADIVLDKAGEGHDHIMTTVSYTLAAGAEIETLEAWPDDAPITLTGNEFGNTIVGSYGSSVLSGGGGIDTLVGNDASDFLRGGADSDRIEGGFGIDTALYDSSPAGVQVNLALGTAAGGDAQGDVLVAIESVLGSAFADVLTGDGNQNVLDGGAGIDLLTGGGGDDIFIFRPGQTNGDTLVDFAGNGAGPGDQLLLAGYDAGATFAQIDATHWQVNYNGDTQHDVITFLNAPAIDPGDVVFV